MEMCQSTKILLKTYPKPFPTEFLNVRHHTQQCFIATIHCLGFHITKPHLQRWREIFTRQLKHSHITTTIHVQRVHNWHRCNGGSENVEMETMYVGLNQWIGTSTRPTVTREFDWIFNVRLGDGFHVRGGSTAYDVRVQLLEANKKKTSHKQNCT